MIQATAKQNKQGQGSTEKSDLAAPQIDARDLAAERRKRLKMFFREFQAFLAFAIPLGFGCALLGGALFFVVSPKLAVAGSGGVLVMILSYRYPRQALWFFMLYMPFAGTVTYWLAGGNSIFQLAKDAFYLPALASLALTYRQSRDPFFKPNSILPALWTLVIFCFLTIVFLSLPRQLLPICNSAIRASGQACKEGKPFLQGVLGLKVFIGYVPLIFCTQILIKTTRELLFFTRSHVLLAITCCGLCLVQLWMLQTGRCQGTDHLSGEDLFRTTLSAKCLVGGALLYSPSQGVIRLPGTFVAPWQWGWFIIANAYITFAAAFSDPSKFWRLVGFVGMASVTMAAVISGQRIALALVPVSFITLLVLTGQFVNWKRFIPIAIGAFGAGVVAWIFFKDLIIQRIESFIGRWQASPADEMILHQFAFVWKSTKGSIVGQGLGTATNSARVFGPTWLIETWFPKILYEIGPIGLLIFFMFVTVLTIVTFKAYRSLQDKNLRSFGACFWVFILFISYQTYYYPLDVDPVAIYYWILIGIVLRLPALDRQIAEQKALVEAEAEHLSPPSLTIESAQNGRFIRIREGIDFNLPAQDLQVQPVPQKSRNHAVTRTEK